MLVYHRVGETVGDFDVAREEFERQMRHLRRCYRVVKAAEILEAAGNRRRGRRFPVAITLDDDLTIGAYLEAGKLIVRFAEPKEQDSIV